MDRLSSFINVSREHNCSKNANNHWGSLELRIGAGDGN